MYFFYITSIENGQDFREKSREKGHGKKRENPSGQYVSAPKNNRLGH